MVLEPPPPRGRLLRLPSLNLPSIVYVSYMSMPPRWVIVQNLISGRAPQPKLNLACISKGVVLKGLFFYYYRLST